MCRATMQMLVETTPKCSLRLMRDNRSPDEVYLSGAKRYLSVAAVTLQEKPD